MRDARSKPSYGGCSVKDEGKQQPDEIDRLIAADPNAHVVEGGPSKVWLLTGDQVKVAREALADGALAEGEPDS